MNDHSQLYRLLSALLCYPEQELLDALTEVEGMR